MELELEYDQATAEKFGNEMIDTLNKASLGLMISLGHRLQIFDKMAREDYLSSREIAQLCGLNERYVSEWLGAMVTGDIIHYDPMSETYHLPPEHAAFLTRTAGPDNIAGTMQYLPILGAVEDQVMSAFVTGKGVSYDHYPRFHEVMAEESDNTVVSFLDTAIIPMVPGLHRLLKGGCKLLDVGCGSGRIINYLAEEYPASHFTGMDFSKEAIQRAKSEALSKNINNTHFELRDLSDFDESAPVELYDVITAFDNIHDQGQPLKVLKGIRRALKNDGVFLMQDIGGTSFLEKDMNLPLAPFLYTISTYHCMSVSLAQAHGEGLGAMWGEAQTRQYLHLAGFTRIETHNLPHDIVNNWYVIHK